MKPITFNYKDYTDLRDSYQLLLEENQSLKKQIKEQKPDVVKCKDCVWAYIDETSDNPYEPFYCMHKDGLGSYVADDDFCCYGEKEKRNDKRKKLRTMQTSFRARLFVMGL